MDKLAQFIQKNQSCSEFVLIGDSKFQKYAEVANVLRDYDKTLVIIIGHHKNYSEPLKEAAFLDNVLIYEVASMSLYSILKSRAIRYTEIISDSVLIEDGIV